MSPISGWPGRVTLAQVLAGTNHALVVNGASTLGSLATGTAGQHLISGGATADPSWVGWQSVVDTRGSAASQNIISQSIPGGTLTATGGGLLVFIHGNYQNNTGASRGLGVSVSYGGTTMWGDTTPAATLSTSATQAGLAFYFLLANAAGTGVQLLDGYFAIGQQSAGSVAGSGKLTDLTPLVSTTIRGQVSVDSTVAQTLTVSTTNSVADAALGMIVAAHIAPL